MTWAIFPEPQCDLQKLWERIYTEWFPTSGYEQVEAPQFEMYYGMSGHTQGEIWIPGLIILQYRQLSLRVDLCCNREVTFSGTNCCESKFWPIYTWV
ncbi:hypothetical protein PCURB6_32310 [Paenibacillus curdlanolyticus]|nr:hypothetical protein PCURB6_32310 [Paenibacillus curdlanolyticus]